MVQRAKIESKMAPLASDFARDFVARRFGAEAAALIYQALPTYSRGARKGQIKGYVHWYKVTEGGWSNGVGGNSGGVYRPGTINVRISLQRDPFAADNGGGVMGDRTSYASNLTDAEWIDYVKRGIGAIVVRGWPGRNSLVTPTAAADWFKEAHAKGLVLRHDESSPAVLAEREARARASYIANLDQMLADGAITAEQHAESMGRIDLRIAQHIAGTISS